MKKLALILTTLLIAVGVLACGTPSNLDVFGENADIYAFSAISSVDLLAGTKSQPASTALAVTLADQTAPIVGDELDELNKYLNIMEKFLGESNGFTFVAEVSDRPEYSHKIVFSTVDMAGDPVTYILYFNEALLDEVTETSMRDLTEVTTEPEQEDETEDEIEAEDEIETEDEVESEDETEFEDQETQISGLLVIDGAEYVVTGKKEIEENEEKIQIRSELDELNYVEVVSKVEENERKFEYTVSVNGVVSKTKVKIEQEDNEQKIQLKFVAGDAKGEYTFKQETEDGETVLKIRYKLETEAGSEEGEIKVLVTVDPVTGETTYNYFVKSDDGKEAEVEKNRDDDHDDEEEDEDESETEATGYSIA
jgi:hypothetical protein